MKKFLSGLTAAVILLTAAAIPVFAESTSASGNCGENATWFINSDAVLVVSGNGAPDTSKPWRLFGNDIQKVVVEDGITELCNGQFSFCKNLTEIFFSSTVTNLGSCIAGDMDSLTDIWLYSDSVKNTFSGSSSLYPKSGSGTKWHVYQGTITETSLREGLKLTDEDFEYITNDQAFPEIENRAPVNVPEVNETSGPCGLLSSYSWDEETKTLTFKGSGGITITEYYQKFADKAENVVMDNSKITSICDLAFGRKISNSNDALFPKLNKVTLPTTLEVIGKYAFYMANITTISLPEGLETIDEGAFSGTSLSGNLILPRTLNTIGQSAFSNTNITLVNLNEGMTLGGKAFSNCNNLKEVIIPKGIFYLMTGTSNAGRSNAAFSGCEGLKKVTIYGGGIVAIAFSSIENGLSRELFLNCPSLEEVIIRADDIEYVEEATLKADGTQNVGTFDIKNGITFYIYKNSTTEKTLRNAGYLTDSNSNVVYIANISALEKAVKSAEDMDTSLHTDESVGSLDKAVKDGKDLILDENATQDDVDNAIKAIEDAIAGLTHKPADYTAVDEAIAKVPADLSIYTDETAAAVTAAVEAVDRTKNITEQEIVDGYVKAIEDAVAGLELKPLGMVSGTITAPGVDTEITVTVTNTDGEVIAEATATDGKYTVSDLEDGEYVITVTSENCAPRSYEAIVADGDATLDAEIHLYGDINGDGEITTADAGMANAHARGAKMLEGYDFEVAEVTGDGKVTTADFGAINAHAQSVRALW